MPPATLGSEASITSVPASETTLSGSDGIAQPAGHVGQEHQLVGAQRLGHGARRLVGVDVVGVALAVGADAGHHRDVVLGHVVEHADVDALDPADEADVLAARGRLAAGAEQQPVVAAQSDRRLAVAVDQQHDVLVDLADQHHLGDLDRLPRPTPASRRRTQPADQAAACSDVMSGPPPWTTTGFIPTYFSKHHVARELLLERGVGHRRAAVLDHHRLAVELPDVRECLEQRGDVLAGGSSATWCIRR